jgi:selenocysteine lyase/cysteine desulfurase
MNEDFDYHEGQEPEPAEAGSFEDRAREDLIDLFNANKDAVFFSRQLKVRLEGNYFH